MLHSARVLTIQFMTGINCIAALKALGELNRMRILRQLLRGKSSVNGIVRRVNISQYTVSKHLKVLKEAGLVEAEQNGREHLYSVSKNLKRQLKSSANVLDLGCCSFRFDRLPK